MFSCEGRIDKASLSPHQPASIRLMDEREKKAESRRMNEQRDEMINYNVKRRGRMMKVFLVLLRTLSAKANSSGSLFNIHHHS